MLHDVNAGMSVPPTTNPVLPTDSPSSARPPIYTLLRANELYILSCFLASLIVDGRSECRLGTLSLLTCDYVTGFV